MELAKFGSMDISSWDRLRTGSTNSRNLFGSQTFRCITEYSSLRWVKFEMGGMFSTKFHHKIVLIRGIWDRFDARVEVIKFFGKRIVHDLDYFLHEGLRCEFYALRIVLHYGFHVDATQVID